MEYPVFCAYYIDVGVGRYVDMANRLRDRCNELGIENDISTPESLHLFLSQKKKTVGTRHWIYRYKPTFVMEMLEKWKKPILYLDADGEIFRKPPSEIFNIPHIGIDYQYGRRGGVKIFNVCAAGIYFNNTELVNDFLIMWERRCTSKYPNKGDHFFLKRVIRHFKKTHTDIVTYFSSPLISMLDGGNPCIRHNRVTEHEKILTNECSSNNNTQ
jgi:hypothetical protein